MMSKKGASLSGWSEAAIGVTLVVLMMGIIIVGFNAKFSKNYNPTFGISSNATTQAFIDYQQTIETGLEGEATTSSLTGISLGTTWSMIKSIVTVILDFVTGGWIENAIGLMQLGTAGTYLGFFLRILFMLSLGFIILRLILKVNP